MISGDFIYETERGTPVEAWREQQSGDFRVPEVVRDMPDIVGVWANYKTYLDRASYLNEWHRQVPAFFMLDDHEILNDINWAGTPGHRDRRAVFRDVGVSA
jgi:phosphodiesterase/alkaline phosphatase D-like protein